MKLYEKETDSQTCGCQGEWIGRGVDQEFGFTDANNYI